MNMRYDVVEDKDKIEAIRKLELYRVGVDHAVDQATLWCVQPLVILIKKLG